MPVPLHKPGRDPRGRRWFPARETPFEARPLVYSNINVGPVTRDDGASTLESHPRLSQFLPNPDATALLFFRSLGGIAREFAAVAAASTLILVPTVAAPAAPTPLKPLVAVVEKVDEAPLVSKFINVPAADLPPPQLDRPLFGRLQALEEPSPSHLATPGSIVEQGLVNLLFQRPVTGVFQPDVIIQPSNVVRVPVADIVSAINVLFQRPLVAVQEVIFDVSSRIIRVPVADVPPAPIGLFLQPLTGGEQLDQPRFGVSLLIGSRLPITPTPLRAIIGVQQDVVDRDLLSRIIRVPIADIPPTPFNVLFQKPLTGTDQPQDESLPEFISTILFGLEPDRDVLFLHPLVGKDQPPVVAGQPQIIVVTAPTPHLDPLFQRPLVGLVQDIAEVGRPGVIRVIPADIPPIPINVLFQKPFAGIVQLLVEVGVPTLIPKIVTAAPTPEVAGEGVYIPVHRPRRR